MGMAMAMAEAKGSLDYWRKFFVSAKANIFDLIEKAIVVAATDRPKEFKDRKYLIVEKLYTSHLPACSEHSAAELQVVNNGDDESPTIGEVVRIKEVLCKHQHESDSVEILKEKPKHRSANVLKLVRTVNDGWKVSADEWAESEAGITEKTEADYVGGLKKPCVTDSEQKPSSLLSARVKRKPLENVSEMTKLENAKRKLHEGYQRIEDAKRQRRIQIIELGDLPKGSLERGRPKKKPVSHSRN